MFKGRFFSCENFVVKSNEIQLELMNIGSKSITVNIVRAVSKGQITGDMCEDTGILQEIKPGATETIILSCPGIEVNPGNRFTSEIQLVHSFTGGHVKSNTWGEITAVVSN